MPCGIDFGTSNSAVAVAEKGKISLIELEQGKVTIPTAVFFNTEEHRTVFGAVAIDEYLEGYTGRLMRALKTILGSDLIGETTQVGAKRLSFSQIIGHFIGHIKGVSENKTGHELSDVVLGRPVYFVDGDDVADKRAENELRAIAAAQGFKNISFEFEPIAAARDYESQIAREELVLVVDIGGGTSDFSLIRLSPDRQNKDDRSTDILANAGVHIGGTDLDRRYSIAAVMPHLGYKSKLTSGLDMPLGPYHTLATWHLINMLYAPKNKSMLKGLYQESVAKDLVGRLLRVVDDQRGHELASKVEQAKIVLSGQTDTDINLGFIEEGWMLPSTQNDLKNAGAADVARIVEVAAQTVASNASVKVGDIHTIFMTGGTTGFPGFAEAIQAAFPAASIFKGDRFSSVAKGLGLSAARRYGS